VENFLKRRGIMNKKYLILISVVFLLVCNDATVGTPELIFPINGVQVDLPLTFIWSSVDNSTGYRIEVDTTLTFSSPVILVDVDDTTYSTSNLDNGTYYWHVAAYNQDDELGDFAYPNSFTVAAGGSAPRNFTLAAANAGESVLLSWNEPLEGQPDGYIVYFKEVNTTNWVVTDTVAGIELQYTHDPVGLTGDYKVSAFFGNNEYDSDELTTIPVHTSALAISELEAAGNAGYGWEITGDFTGSTYSMADAASAAFVDFYITNFTDDPMGGPWPAPWCIASPDLAPSDPGGSFVPTADWRDNGFTDPITDPHAPVPNYSVTTYFNFTEGIENDPTYIAVHLNNEDHYGLVKFSGVNPTAGTIEVESWFQTVQGLRLMAH
jgi:hypothetical protein